MYDNFKRTHPRRNMTPDLGSGLTFSSQKNCRLLIGTVVPPPRFHCARKVNAGHKNAVPRLPHGFDGFDWRRFIRSALARFSGPATQSDRAIENRTASQGREFQYRSQDGVP
jgi:hypothetical protein